MRRSVQERAFTLIEIMVTVAIVGVLAIIAIPMFMSQTSKAKASEAVLQLNQIGRNATAYYREKGTFPQGTATVLPGADGEACKHKDRRFPSSTEWRNDPMWSELEFLIGDPTLFSYHYESKTPKSARAWAVADPSCSGKQEIYEMFLEGRAGGNVESLLVTPQSRKTAVPPTPEP